VSIPGEYGAAGGLWPGGWTGVFGMRALLSFGAVEISLRAMVERWAALLRGIDLRSRNTVPMAERLAERAQAD
jgi:hypothetical protein